MSAQLGGLDLVGSGSERKADGEAEEGSRIAALIVAVQPRERLCELHIQETETQQRHPDTGADRRE